eukprot:gene2537-3274_t
MSAARNPGCTFECLAGYEDEQLVVDCQGDLGTVTFVSSCHKNPLDVGVIIASVTIPAAVLLLIAAA